MFSNRDADNLDILLRYLTDTDTVSVRRVNLLARAGNLDLALDVLHEGHGTNFIQGDFFLALSDSIYEFPEALRRHPRYHEFFLS